MARWQTMVDENDARSQQYKTGDLSGCQRLAKKQDRDRAIDPNATGHHHGVIT